MKTFVQYLIETSLGHSRIGRLAKTGNLSHERLDHYVKKHIKRADSWGISSDYDHESKVADIDLARDHVKMQIHRNIKHYNKNKHKAKQHYSPDNVQKHISTRPAGGKLIPHETDWSDPERPERDPMADRPFGGHVRKESYVDEGIKRALRRKGPGAEQYVSNEIKRQAHRAAKSIVDIESLGNKQDELTKHRAKLKPMSMHHPNPRVRANTRNMRQDIKTKRDDVAIQALDKQRNFDKFGGKLNDLAARRDKLRAFKKAKEIDAKNPITRNKDLPSPLGHGNF